MAYMIPLVFVNVSPKMSICASRIVAMVSTETLAGERLVKEERRAKTLLHGAGNKPVRTAIIMDTGTVVSSAYTVQALANKIAIANSRALGTGASYPKDIRPVDITSLFPKDLPKNRPPILDDDILTAEDVLIADYDQDDLEQDIPAPEEEEAFSLDMEALLGLEEEEIPIEDSGTDL